MKRQRAALTALILIEILLLFLGCHGDGHDLLAPSLDNDPGNMLTDEIAADSSGATPPALWGYYEIVYDPLEHNIDAIPLRGPAFAFNVVTFLQPPSGSAYNMGIEILDDSQFLNTGRIDTRVLLHHPFPGQDFYTGFDVCGIFITEGSMISPVNPKLNYADPAVDPILLNRDGHTRWMNPAEFLTGDVFGYESGFWGTSESSENSGFVAGATLNPYKYFAHELGPAESLYEWLQDSESIMNRGIFPSGSSCSRDYELQFPIVDNQIVFIYNYAVLANWVEPDYVPVINPAKDFPPEANALYPQHIFVTDNSEVYHTPSQAGGTLSFEIEIFDWDVFLNWSSIPNEVSKITIWSDESLVPGGSVEFLSTEVEWNSGFLASTSVASIEIFDAVPSASGDSSIWIAIESANPSSYYQGFDAEVPDDPIAAYMHVPIQVADCPKAYMDHFGTNAAGTGTIIQNMEITGENFIDGEDLGAWLEIVEAGGEDVSGEAFEITGFNVTYIDSNRITADFDFTSAPMGNYACGCINGCGEITTPEENESVDKNAGLMVVPPTPFEIELSTGRTTSTPASIDVLYLSWSMVEEADYYYLYVKCSDTNGNVISSDLLGMSVSTSYAIPINSLPLYGAGIIETWVSAVYEDEGSNTFESFPSQSGYMFFHGFESGLGMWSTLAENSMTLEFVRSSVDSAYDGSWGLKTLGYVPWSPPIWIAFATPPIPEVDGATTVHFEFLHRYRGIIASNGYQVGWCSSLPANGDPTVLDYNPLTTVSYGHDYPDDNCSALRIEFNIDYMEDYNFQSNLADWEGWYLSGFDASNIIGNGQPDYLIIGMAGDDFDLLDICIDEVAVLIY